MLVSSTKFTSIRNQKVYNRGKEYKPIKEIFDELVILLGDLSEESKRVEEEGLQEEELMGI